MAGKGKQEMRSGASMSIGKYKATFHASAALRSPQHPLPAATRARGTGAPKRRPPEEGCIRRTRAYRARRWSLAALISVIVEGFEQFSQHIDKKTDVGFDHRVGHFQSRSITE